MAEVRLLGPLEVVVDGEPLALGGRKQRSVLAMLALDPNRVLSIDRLIDGVWGESAADGARRTLQVYISNLRSALRPATDLRIESRAPGYVLEVDPEAIDLHRFGQTSAEARRLLEEGRFSDASARLDEAHALWRGAPLDDLALEPFAEVGGLERLHEARVTLLEDRVDVALALGRHEEAVAEAEALVTSHPLRERPWGQLMLALYRAGRQADVLRAYGRARDTLVEELGIEPGPALRDLEGRILGQDPELAPAARVATPVDAVPLASLPKPTAALVGRAAELADVTALLIDPDVRLVTLVGPGGVGKTRLAVALAEAVAGQFPGGAAFVGLSAVDDAEQVLAAVAQALGVPDDPAGDVAGAIAGLLGTRPTLLVLDNLEQVVDAAPQVAALLGAAGSLTVLATSRIALRISGEHEVPLGPLALPGTSAPLDELARCESIEMFVSRCQARSPGFALTDANAADVADICVRLDGLPLAIELAAARSKVLRPADLRARLVDSLGVLVGGGKDLPDRHRTLRATLEWSYGLLEPEHQALLDRLGVFAGSFRLEGAEEVGADPSATLPVLDGLTTLVDNSLVRPLDAGPALRFELLRAVRDFAWERLAERGELDERRALHADHVLAEARAARDRLDGPDGTAATAELLAGDADQRAVFQHALDRGDAATAADLAIALRPFWVAQGRLRDGRVWLASALDAPDLPDATRAPALVAAGALAYYQDDLEAARTVVEDGIARARVVGDDESLALGLCFLASSLTAEGNLDDATPLAAEALELAASGPAYEPHVVALSLAALLAGLAGDHDAEVGRHEERLALARRQGDRARVADTLNTLAEIALDDGRTGDARALAEEALVLARGTSRLSTRDVLLTSGRIELAGGDGPAAHEALGEALVLCVEFGQPYELAQCLRAVGSVAVLDGDADSAARLFGGAEAVQGGGDSAFPVEPDLAGHRDAARAALGDAAFEAALGSGRTLGSDDVVALAQEVTGAGRVSASASARSTPS